MTPGRPRSVLLLALLLFVALPALGRAGGGERTSSAPARVVEAPGGEIVDVPVLQISPERGAVPLWIKVGYTLVVLLIVPFYLANYGPQNFLWFSDIALLVTVPALWLESRILASTMAVGVLLPELAWNIDFFGRVLTGKKMIGLAGYMFDPEKPLYLRALSLFHVIVPVVLVFLVARLGYEPDALVVQTLLAWIVLPVTYRFTDPERNINWVFGPGKEPQSRIPPRLYLLLLMVFFPLFIYLPTHLLLTWIFPSP